MKQFILTLIFILLVQIQGYSQTWSHSGYIRTEGDTGVKNVPVKLYSRVIPNITGFTSQTNYNGHSYYRSTSNSTWTSAKSACENMGGHLATISTSGENSFLFGTWPSGWIGLYQDKGGAFYSEPNGGWRWTENDIDDYKHNYDSKNYTTTLVDNVGSKNATMYNGPTLTTSSGNYVQFDGTNDYSITGDVSGSFPNVSEVQTLQLLCYPESAGILVTELGTGSASSGWHAAVMEITTSGTLKVGFWNTGGTISSISTTISMNTWHLITMTYDGSTLRGYLDGTYFGTSTFNREVPHSSSSNGMYYALAKSESTNMGSGAYGKYRLGYFRIFNRKLSDDEIDRAWMSISYRYGRMKYLNWNSGEPNNAGSEDYIQFVSGGRWNDLPNSSLPYVIEFDYIVDTTDWVMEDSIVTDVNGRYSFSKTYNPSKQYYIEVVTPKVSSNISSSDFIGPSKVSIGEIPLKSYQYHKCDLNNDGYVTVGDVYHVARILNGLSFTKKTLLFTSSQWTTLSNGTTNLKSTIPGITTNYTFTPTSGGTTNFYLLSPGYTYQSKLTY